MRKVVNEFHIYIQSYLYNVKTRPTKSIKGNVYFHLTLLLPISINLLLPIVTWDAGTRQAVVVKHNQQSVCPQPGLPSVLTT